MEDVLIMQRIAQGDRTAFAELYTKYNQFVFNTALLYTTDQQRALTMVKTAFRDVYNFVLANGPYTGDMQAWLHALLISQNTQAQPFAPPQPPQPPQQSTAYIQQPTQQQGAEYWQQPSSAQQQPAVQGQGIYGKGKPKKERKQKVFKPWYKRVWVWVIAGVVVLSIASSLGDESEKPDAVAPPAPTIDAPATNAEVAAPPASSDAQDATLSKEAYIAGAKSINYDDLVRQPDQYTGEVISVTVQISQIIEGGLLSDGGFRGYENRFSSEWYISYDIPEGEPRLLADDIVTFYGEFNGLTTIKRALTGTRENVPGLLAKYHQMSNANELSGNISNISFGDTFTFDDFEIVFTEDIQWAKVDNQYSDKHGADVFSVPITLKNIGLETHGLNFLYYSQFGTNGLKLDSVGSYFENDIGSAGSLRPGAEQTSRMYFLYDGDGEYFVEFDEMFGKKVEVRLLISK